MRAAAKWLKSWVVVFLLLVAMCSYSEAPLIADHSLDPYDEFGQYLESIDLASAGRVQDYIHLRQLFDSLEAAESSGSFNKSTDIRAQLANLFRRTGNYHEGIRFYRIAISQLNDDDPVRKVEIYHGLAAIYYELYLHSRDQQHYLDSASVIAARAYGYAEMSGSATHLSDVLNLMGAVNKQSGHYDEAIQQLQLAHSINQTLWADRNLAVPINLSYAHYLIKSYDMALSYAQQAYKEATDAGDIGFAANSLNVLATIYQAKGDTASARNMLNDRQRLIDHDDYLIGSLIMRQLHLNHERRQDDKVILGLSQERYYFVRLSRILLIGIFLLFILLITIFIVLRQSKKLHRAEMELAREKERAVELQNKNITLQLEDKKREEQKLKDELYYKQGLLTSKMLHIAMMIEFLNQLKAEINQVKDSNGEADINQYFEKTEKEISKQLKGNIWDEFEMLYASGNNNFIGRLIAAHPELNQNDKRLSYLIMSNFTTKEIANVLSKSYRSVEMARHRLRAKLGLDKDTTLEAYFGRYMQQAHL